MGGGLGRGETNEKPAEIAVKTDSRFDKWN